MITNARPVPATRVLCAGLTLLALLTNGCSGSGSTSSLPGTAHAAAPAAPTSSARFVIRVPVRNAPAAAAKRAPAYISAATQSITVAVTGPTTLNQTANLTPASTGCQSTSGMTTCTLTLALSPGNYSASLTTYDAANGTGNVLSADQNVAFTVVSGQANTVALILNGVPAQLLMVPLTAAAISTGVASFKLSGAFPASMQATALDIDGNIIVGPGSPAFTVAQTGGNPYFILPAPASPNVFMLIPPVGNGVTTSFTLTAAYGDGTCSRSGAVCTTTFTATTHQQTMIVDNDGPVTVLPYPYQTHTSLAGYGSSAGLPGVAAFDSAGNLWIGDNSAGDVKEYAPPYTGSPVTSIGDGTLQDVIPVVMSPAGNLFVGGFNNNAVYEYAPPYTGAPRTITNGISGPASLAFDAAGDLFVANFTGNNVTEYVPPYTGAPVTLGSLAQALEVAASAGGDVFAIGPGANSIALFVPPYSSESSITSDTSAVSALAVGPDGTTLFAGQSGFSRIDTYVPPYSSVAISTANQTAASPAEFAFDAAADLFSADQGNNRVTIYAPPYTGTPLLVTSGVSQPTGVYISP